jgi:DedD protein
MDRRVKERLIGASILVAVAVLVVPELLSGPKTSGPAPLSLPAGAPEPTRTVTVDLATSKTSPTSSAPESTANERAAAQAPGVAEPSPGAAGAATPLETATPSPKSSSGANAVSPATSSTVSAPSGEPSVPAGVPSASAASREWAVQLGSFASFANAEKLLVQLKAQGYLAYVSSSGVGTSLRYRVRVGPLSDRGTAAHTAQKLKEAGHIATVVPPAP